MPVKIRLQRRGRTKRPFYHIVVADVRAPRDGRFIEKLGVYNPMTKPATIELDQMRAYEWLMNGAQPTDTARNILRFKGVMYYKHLMRGVKKGALTQEQADAQWKDWIEKKEARIAERRAATEQEHADWLARIDGKVKQVKRAEPESTSADSEKSPKQVAEEQKTLAELAAEKAPAELELTEEKPKAEETAASEEPKAEETTASETAEPEVKEEGASEAEPAKAEEKPAEEAQDEKKEETTAAGSAEESGETGSTEEAAGEETPAQSEDETAEAKSEEE